MVKCSSCKKFQLCDNKQDGKVFCDHYIYFKKDLKTRNSHLNYFGINPTLSNNEIEKVRDTKVVMYWRKRKKK